MDTFDSRTADRRANELRGTFRKVDNSPGKEGSPNLAFSLPPPRAFVPSGGCIEGATLHRVIKSSRLGLSLELAVSPLNEPFVAVFYRDHLEPLGIWPLLPPTIHSGGPTIFDHAHIAIGICRRDGETDLLFSELPPPPKKAGLLPRIKSQLKREAVKRGEPHPEVVSIACEFSLRFGYTFSVRAAGDWRG
jgi:hypothetical protein